MRNLIMALLLVVGFSCFPGYSIPSFPGAEGFGAQTTGGRGGRVVYVTNLNIDGPGSLKDALSKNEPRYVLFKVSGHIKTGDDSDGRWLHMRYGNVTVAGQTSPGGVTAHGILSDNAYHTNRDNVIIRHMRFRPETRGVDDCMRLIECRDAIVDHCSFGHSMDETIQISYITNYTIQNCILAEKGVEELGCDGILIKYTSLQYPLNNLSLHHNILNRLYDRMPSISCSDDLTNPGCLDGVEDFNLEISNNVMWDPNNPIRMTNRYDHEDNLFIGREYNANYVGNLFYVRATYPYGMFGTFNADSNQIYLADNKISIYPDLHDYQLVFCCNSFNIYHPNTEEYPGIKRTERNPFPAITYNHDRLNDDVLLDYMYENAGAFPRDSMDRRLMKYVAQRAIDPTGWNICGENGANDGFLFDFDTLNPPAAPADADSDGMPDYWEIANGLNPHVQDHTGKELSVRYTGIEGYDNLECYLNRLSDSVVTGVSTVIPQAEAEQNVARNRVCDISMLPNPCNPSTVIKFEKPLAQGQSAEITVYDIKGHCVTRIVTTNDQLNIGVVWEASNKPSGIYVVRIMTKGFSVSGKLILQK